MYAVSTFATGMLATTHRSAPLSGRVAFTSTQPSGYRIAGLPELKSTSARATSGVAGIRSGSGMYDRYRSRSGGSTTV